MNSKWSLNILKYCYVDWQTKLSFVFDKLKFVVNKTTAEQYYTIAPHILPQHNKQKATKSNDRVFLKPLKKLMVSKLDF